MTARIMLVPDWLRTTPVAHRGLHDANRQVPENSLAAFLQAIEHGFAIECDIRLSRDGVPMVFHDATLERLCQRKEALRDLTAEQLTLAPLAGTAETIPTLGDMLRLVNGQVPLLIEVKNYNNEPVGPLEAATAAVLRDYKGRFAVQSFNPRTVAWFRRHAPGFVRGQIASHINEMMKDGPLWKKLVLYTMLANRYGDPHFVAYDINYLPAPLTLQARSSGRPVLTWTIRTPEQEAKARQHADNIIFERPAGPERA